MLTTSWKKCVAALFLAALCPAVVAGDDLADLKARLDAIEMENKQLRDDLDALKSADEAMIGQMTELNGQVVGKADKKPDDPLSFSAKWNNGFEASTKDKTFKFHVGGRVQFDTVFLEASRGAFAGTGPFTDQDAVTFRRARLRADGTMYETIDWCAEFDFVNSVNDNPGTTPTETNVITIPVPTDLWITFREVPIVNNLRIGNVKEPIGFEHLTSSRYLEFMERSYNQDIFTGAFNNGFTPGVVVWDNWADEHGTWSTGVFKNNSNGFGYGIGDGEYAWTSRVTYLPWFEDEGRYLTHLGVSGSVRDPNNHQSQYRARGSLRNGMGGVNPTLANTGLFNTTEVEMAGLEFVHQMDSLMFQAEYMGAWNHKVIGNGTSAPAGAQLGDVYVYGWYAETLYFLTGEHREYEKKTGVFGRVIPKNNYGKCGHLGAFQVGARYNQLCLVDSGMDGGRLDDVTLGLNWFLNPNLKIQSNYTYTIRDAQASPGGGDYYGYGMRVAWDF